jgi:hypothetical protein
MAIVEVSSITPADAEALYHFMAPKTSDPVVYHNGCRYAGFTGMAHAEFFVRRLGLLGATIADRESIWASSTG